VFVALIIVQDGEELWGVVQPMLKNGKAWGFEVVLF
jgi:hypothetical protein